jgi:threonine/homoserine/homoserine lactone efflux protein
LSVTNFQFFLAALIIAAVPGPGILYVAARTLSGGRAVGLASTAGTALGGLVHVIAGGLGVSAIILASAQAFAALKFAGALYLVWLGIRTFRDAGRLPAESTGSAGAKRAFLEGIAVEALNPLLPGVHSAIPGSSRPRSRAHLHGAWPDLGHA